jgi:hypothetical protein
MAFGSPVVPLEKRMLESELLSMMQGKSSVSTLPAALLLYMMQGKSSVSIGGGLGNHQEGTPC